MIHRRLSQSFLIALILAMAALLTATLNTADQDMLISAAAALLIIASLLLERLFPHDRTWNAGKGDTGGDVASFVLIFGALDSLLKFAAPFIVLLLLPEQAQVWTAPLWLQIIAATALIELAAWFSHWAHHTNPHLWSLHAMHHSTTRLYTLNNFRFHPLNHLLNYVVAFLPPLLVGIHPDALLAYAALSLPILILQHSNISFDFGGLNFIFNTNELHRWHHSTNPNQGTKNLGRALVLWDQAFGTFHYPAQNASPKAVGLFHSSRNYPAARHFMRQLAWPFSKSCCT